MDDENEEEKEWSVISFFKGLTDYQKIMWVLIFMFTFSISYFTRLIKN